jgi:plastocyanin
MHSANRASPLIHSRGSLIRIVVAMASLLADAAVPAAPTTAPVAVAIRNFMFEPGELTVTAGTTVTWTNRDDDAHSVVSIAGLFHSSALDTGESFRYTFDKAGTYRVTCSLHPRMAATIVVN